MKQYHDFLKHILDYGVKKEDRTGTGTISAIVPPQMRFDLSEGFPIVTSKKVFFKGVKYELKWFTKGDTNIKYLIDNGINIWTADAYRWFDQTIGTLSKEEFIKELKTDPAFCREYGELGPIYGRQWRGWKYSDYEFEFGDGSIKGTDQLRNVVEQIKQVRDGNHKYARRLIVSAWNVGFLYKMVTPPCHVLFQFFVTGKKLSIHLYQRSGDAFLGIPFNISSYALLLHIVAAETELEVGEFIHTVGDAHIYLNHLDQVKEQLTRTHYNLPTLSIPSGITIDNWEPSAVSLVDYKHHPTIKGDLSV